MLYKTACYFIFQYKIRYVHISVIAEGWKRALRISSLGEAYSRENGEKSLFSDLLYCADCGSKLWHHYNTINRDIRFFSCSLAV